MGPEKIVARNVADASEHQNLAGLEFLWKIQEQFQNRVLGRLDVLDLDPIRKAAMTRDFCAYTMGELVELLQQLEWKTHRRDVGSTVIRSNVLEEWVDVLKYVLSIGIMWGFTPQDLVTEFVRKSKVVEQRYRQEHEFRPEAHLVCVFDLDGVLADYVLGFLRFVNEAAPERYRHKVILTDIKSMDLCAELVRLTGMAIELAVRLKHEFRELGWKQYLLPMPGAAEVLEAVRKVEGQIVLLSARPGHQYKRIVADTMLWLEAHHLPYDALYLSLDKREFMLRALPSVCCVVEDNPSEAMRLAGAGYRVLLMDRIYNRVPAIADYQMIFRYGSLFEVAENIGVGGLWTPNER